MANFGVFLICIFASCYALGQVGSNRRYQVLDIKYETGCQQAFNKTHDEHTYKANMGCSVNNGKFVEVCAELPRNWRWEDYNGYVYMDIYNETAGTRLNTSRTLTGVPLQCVTIKSWPGGDLYIKVQPNNFHPIYYTLSVQVEKMMTAKHTARSMSAKGLLPSNPAWKSDTSRLTSDTKQCIVPQDSHGNYLMSLIFMTNAVEKLEMYEALEVRLDVCTANTNSQLRMSVHGFNGAYTFYTCKRTPCNPDSPSHFISQSTPLVVSHKSGPLAANLDSVYTVIRTFTGKEDPAGSRRYYGNFKLGAVAN